MLLGRHDHRGARADRVEDRRVGHVHLDAAAGDVDVLVERRGEVRLPDHRAGQRLLPQRLRPAVVDVRSADQLEGTGGAATLGQVGPLEHAGARVDERGVRGRHVRRRHDPRQTGVGVGLAAVPALHLHDVDLQRLVGHVRQELGREVQRQLADGHGVLLADLAPSDERREGDVEDRTARNPAGGRVRPVQDDEALARSRPRRSCSRTSSRCRCRTARRRPGCRRPSCRRRSAGRCRPARRPTSGTCPTPSARCARRRRCPHRRPPARCRGSRAPDRRRRPGRRRWTPP